MVEGTHASIVHELTESYTANARYFGDERSPFPGTVATRTTTHDPRGGSPEMLAALRNAGWHNYTLFMDEEFMDEDGTLFGYFETPDSLETAQADMEETEVNARWQDEIAPFCEAPEPTRPDRSLIRLEEVFHLD